MARRSLVLALILAVAGLAAASRRASAQDSWPQKIRDIRVFDNTKTATGTVIDLCGVSTGEEFTPDQLETVKSKLVNSGLFSEVNLYYEPYEDGIRLNIVARDKFAWFAAPTFSASDGNVGGGIVFGHTNLFGRNKKLVLYAALFSSDSRFLVAYQDPALFGSRVFWRFDGGVARSKIDEFNLDLASDANLSNPELFRRTPVWQTGAGIQIGLNLPLHLRLAAYYRIQDLTYEKACISQDCANGSIFPSSPLLTTANGVDQPSPDGREAYFHFDFGYDSTVNTWGIKTGTAIGAWYEYGDKSIGSSFKYDKFGGGIRHQIRFFEEHNLILRGGAAYAENPPFTEEFEAGGSGLRGFNYREFRGDTSFDGHIEYYIPFFWAYSMAFRGLVFYDSQAVWFRNIDASMVTPGGTYMVVHPD